MNEFVDNTVRDAVLNSLLQQPDNKLCFDCKMKNPKWSSSNIGVFLCYQCTSKHRSMGVHISFVRSLKMDRWKRRELKQMELGGNKNVQQFYKEHAMIKDGKPDHEHPLHTQQKQVLAAKAEAAIRQEIEQSLAQVQTQQQPPQSEHKAQALSSADGSAHGLQSCVFDFTAMTNSSPSNGGTKNEVYPSAPQATFQAISVPTSAMSNLQKSDQLTSHSKRPMQLGKKAQIDQQQKTQGSITFARRPDNAQVKSLNAKKLNIDFTSDDFFDSFQPAKSSQEQQLAGQFLFVPHSKKSDSPDDNETLSNNSTDVSHDYSVNDEKALNQQAQERLSQLGQRKAISSADFQMSPEQEAEMQSRFKSLAGATQISSEMIFGAASKPTHNSAAQSGFSTQKLAENAQNLKDNASEFCTSLYSRLSQAKQYYTSQW